MHDCPSYKDLLYSLITVRGPELYRRAIPLPGKPPFPILLTQDSTK